MTTTSNQILWAVRGIEDTETLRTALIEIERVLYSMARSTEYQVSEALQIALDQSTPAIYAVLEALPERNTNIEDGIFIAEAGA